ncbi:MAG TPA: CHASE domain-containing protein, partial [Candidatus Acidoferrales bacterium]|nr:CHASE domain-containing protein [Candidatus Acidoferrales bacterium]
FLASFFINIETPSQIMGAVSIVPAVGMAVSLGIGATLQAIAGAFLIRLFALYPTTFVEARKTIKFLGLGGPVSCLVYATWGVTSLFLAGIIQLADYPFQWWTWWVGDTIGVITITPSILIWAGRPFISRRRRVSVSGLLCVVYALVVLCFVYTKNWEEDRIKLAFDRRTDRLAQKIQENFDNYINILHSVENLYMSSVTVSRQQFKIFVRRWLSLHPGMRAISWTPRILDTERLAYEQAGRREGLGNIQITEQNPREQFVRASQRAVYFPVYYLESLGGNERALGFDVASDPIRREALDRARDTGKPTATDHLTLIQDVKRDAGFVVFLPVYRFGLSQDSVAERRVNLEGYVVGAFRIRDIMNAALKVSETRDIEIRLYDARDEDRKGLIYEYRSQLAAPDRVKADPGIHAAALQRVIPFEIAGRRWIVQYTPTKQYLAVQRRWQDWSILAGGLLFASLCGVFFITVTGHAEKIEDANRQLLEEVAERKFAEDALRRSEARKGAILESAIDCIITIDHLGNIVEFNPAAEKTFGYSHADAVGKRMSELIVPSCLREKCERGLEGYLSTGKGLVLGKHIETTAMRADGSEFPIELAITRTSLEGPPLFTGFVRDITKRKLAQDEVAKLATIVEAADDSIVGTTMDGIITSWNRGAKNIYGYAIDEVKGGPISILYPPEFIDELPRLRQKLARGEGIAQYETVRLRKDGTRVDVSLTLSPVRDAQGSVVSVASVTRDISDRKRAERELQRQREDIAHRLHDSVIQSLTAIGMHLELAEMKLSQNPDAAWQHLQKIKRTVNEEQQHLRSLVRELKGVGLSAPMEDFQRVEALHALFKRLGNRWGVRVELEASPELSYIPPPIAAELVYIVQESVANAVRHGRASVVKLTMASEGEKLVMSIRDNGRGFPFRGTYDAAALDVKRTGPVTLKSRIASLGGSLTICSADSGSCLEITLPLNLRGASDADHVSSCG